MNMSMSKSMIRSLRFQRKSLQLLSGHRHVLSSTQSSPSPSSSLSLSLSSYSTTTTNDATNQVNQPHQPHHDHDILICGGGVVGSFLAADILHQSKGQCSVGIIDNTTPTKEISTTLEPPFIRVYALSPLR